MLSPFGKIVWEDRYALKDEYGKLIEKNILETFRRVATAIASKEKDSKFWGDKFYKIMADQSFCPAGRVLAHSGTHYSQLLNCFVLPFQDDSLEEIMNTGKNMAIVQKYGGGCIGGESNILTNKGVVPLKEIVEGNDKDLKVLSFNSDNNEMEYCDILERHTNNLSGDRVFEIEFDNTKGGVASRIRASDWHPFFVFDGVKIIQVRADELKPGMAVIGSTDLGVNLKYDSMGWLLGYIAGDGSIDTNNGEDVRVRVVDDSEECVKRAAGIFNTSYKPSSDKRYKVKMWACEVYGDEAGMVKDEFGGYQTSGTKHVPNSIWESSPERRLSFLVGHIDADGWFNKEKKRFEVFTVSNELAKELIALAGGLGIRASLRFRKSRKENEQDGWEVRYSSSQFSIDLIVNISAKHNPLNAGWVMGTINLSHEWKDHLKSVGINVYTNKAWRKSIEIDGVKRSLVYWLQHGKASRETAASILRVCGEEKIASAVLSSQIVLSSKATGISETLYDLTIAKNQTYMASDPTTGAYVVVHNTGFNFSRLRPSGSYIKGVNGRSSGPIGFISMMSTISEIIEQGGTRRGASIGLLEAWHPDLWEFVSYKTEHNWECLREFIDVNDYDKWESFKYENLYKWQMFNVSVGITDDFLESVKNNKEWVFNWKGEEWELYTVIFKKYISEGNYKELTFEVTANNDPTAIWKVRKKIPYPTGSDIFEVTSKRKVKASEIWDRLCYNAWADGCPGIINLSTARRMHNLEYAFPIEATNPCFTGDCKLDTINGPMTFESLEDKEIDLKTPYGSIEKGRIWKTGVKSTIRLKFNDGSSITVTPDQLFLCHKGKEIRAKDCLNKCLNTSDIPLSVVSIEDNGEQEVYDFSIPCNWGIVNGIVAHNCGEQPLGGFSSCNLSSILLPNFVIEDTKSVDWDKLKEVVHTAVRFSDNVVDNCEFPIPEIKDKAYQERRVGLGTMGVHDMLIKMGLDYDSDVGRDAVEEVLRFIRDEAYKASIKIAEEKGSFPAFKKKEILKSGFIKTLPPEIVKLIGKNGIRNSALLSQAPTGSISALNNVSSGCEPWYSLSFQRNTRLGSYEDGCPTYIEWKKNNPEAPIPSYFKTAPEISPTDHVKMLILFSKYIDSAVSKTVNLPNHTTVDTVKETFIYAMENGVKGLTVFRDGSKEGVLVNKQNKKKIEEIIPYTDKEDCYENVMSPKKRGDKTTGSTYRIHMQSHNLYVTVNRNRDGDLVELFTTVGESKKPNAHHTSGVEDSWAEGLGKIISLALRAGVKPSSIIRNLKNIPSDKPVFVTIGDNENSEHIPSPPHAIARVIEDEMSNGEEEINIQGGYCSECGSTNTKKKSPTCYECFDCGYVACG